MIEGGKGIAVSNGESSGAWAAAGGVGTFSGVNADHYDAAGNRIPWVSFPLPDPLLGPAETEMWYLQFRQRDRDEVLAPPSDEFAMGKILADV